ncbi:IS1595 family transposase [Nitratireductor mangrovi]|uniref:IS1595 family transposase n=1 Tax=Nitratireductor mangrovi TaxID=2599600 RepID=A0A5B8KZR9_9HYPH|nr:IS1595 family transposase [Nitratireductor mangrovi]QDZ01109.1 IS1595 family transposase [Nitratireductor mangrovi]
MDITAPIYTDPDKAREHLEAIHWPHGPICPHCKNSDHTRITKLEGKSTRPGVYKCKECRKPFTVTVGTVFERSKIPLNKWVLASHLMASSKKGMSAHQLWRMLGFGSYRTAWFMMHRIREAMMEKTDTSGPIGGEGKTVEVDETYFGPKDRITTRTIRGKPGHKSKRMVVALVERGGHTRMFYVEKATAADIRDVMVRNISRRSVLHTDESRLYVETGKEYAKHQTVRHTAGEYVRYEDGAIIHSNTVENVFSVLKRGMRGTYQHCGEAHLHRYLAEFGFRYNRRSALGIEDWERAEDLLRGARDKRLTYRRTDEAAHA